MIVVDASVAAKWFLPELDSCEAERLLEGPETMTAPDLIRIEVAAAICRRFRLGDLDAGEAGELCEEWFKAISRGRDRSGLEASELEAPRGIDQEDMVIPSAQ